MHRVVGVLAYVVFYGVAENKVVDVTTPQQAFNIGVGAGSCTASVHINLPADTGILEDLENSGRRDKRRISGSCSSLVDVTVRGAGNQKFPVWRRAGHYRREPGV